MNESGRKAATRMREQVILPWPVAVRITLRGLKIRLGRSLITMSGVVLGIAFLMSVLTGEALRSGLADETRTRTEVNRLVKLVEEEIGTFADHTLGVIISGAVTDRHQRRMLEAIAARVDPGSIRVFNCRENVLESRGEEPVEGARGAAFTYVSELSDLCRDAHALLFLAEAVPELPPDTMRVSLAAMRQPVILDYHHGRYTLAALRDVDEQAVYTSLSYEMSEEEALRAARRKRQDRARKIWITIVSMLVTVIGISNAMLMSVTERIREIGTMKCLGALSGFVVKLFMIESLIIGALGASVGTVFGFAVPFVAYMFSSGVALLLRSTPFTELGMWALLSVSSGTVLAIIAAIYPGFVAARMVPADALRTNV